MNLKPWSVSLLIALCLTISFGSINSAHAQDNSALRRTPTVRAVERVLPSVVNISTKTRVVRRSPLDSFFQFRETPRNNTSLRDDSLGSGVIIDPKGYLVTNHHVIRQAAEVTVALSSGKEYRARVVGSDTQNDIAVLKIMADGPFPAAELGRTDDLMIGEPTIALGNPFGLSGSVTTGILSASERTVRFRGKQIFSDFLQTSAVINPGNSGGPLLNILGQVIGINVAIHSRGPGISFAIPASRVREVIYRVLDPRVSKKAHLGIEVAHSREEQGSLITKVESDSLAEKKGFRVGDRILKLNGRRVRNWIDYCTALGESEVGKKLELEIARGAKRISQSLLFKAEPPTPQDQSFFDFVGFEFRDIPRHKKAALGNVNGIVVTKVYKGSSAENIGLQAGDIIDSLANYTIDSTRIAKRVLVRAKNQEGIQVLLFRQNETGRYDHYRGEILFNK